MKPDEKSPVDLFTSEMDNLQEQIRKAGTEKLAPVFREIFEKNPGLESIRWTQYTPYFNDGEECVFRVHLSYPDFRYRSEEDFDEEGYSEDSSRRERNRSIAKELGKLSNYPEPFRAIFGDHVRVTATREGFEVTEYSHD